MGSDLNPHFRFDLGGDSGAAQTPWELAGPLPIRPCIASALVQMRVRALNIAALCQTIVQLEKQKRWSLLSVGDAPSGEIGTYM